jgi:hypothetical protein
VRPILERAAQETELPSAGAKRFPDWFIRMIRPGIDLDAATDENRNRTGFWNLTSSTTGHEGSGTDSPNSEKLLTRATYALMDEATWFAFNTEVQGELSAQAINL